MRLSACVAIIFISLFILNVAHANPKSTEALNPIAAPESIIVFGKARFTLLTPELIRMEYSEEKIFEDKASLAIINRRLPTPEFSQKILNNKLVIRTNNLHLMYIDDGRSFSKENLHVDIIAGKKNIATWQPGKTDDKNLKGTLRTLDQANGWDFESKLENGVISRTGWALIDDSNNQLFDGDPDWNWVVPRSNTNTDWYLFGYGSNYKQALFDFTRIAGKIPMPPKYAFGYWWSRYWIYNDNEIRNLVKQIRDFDIPLDVFIIDMDWHETYGFSALKPEVDSQGQNKGWTGYTWNKNLFPQPEKFMQWLNEQNLKTALNLHPASGVPTMEEKYAEFAQKYGFKPVGEYIPYLMSEKKWAEIYFDTLLKPMEDWGVDFWWLDWQQHLQDKKISGLSVTWWMNYTFFSHMEKSENRPMIFHRWGGLGNHRYPIGFSGDANTNWETLDFQAYFTATAANVGYGYWSHDIGGHITSGNPTDGELYLRWIQFGALSPILRTHSSKISLIERRPWMFPEYFSAMRDAIKFRYQLAPYIYAAARKTYDTGVAFVHPLYYEYPDSSQAYSYKSEYFFGDDIIAAPITSPVNPSSHLAEKKIWLPKGNWFEYSSGTLLKGDRETIRYYAVEETPVIFKGGSIIPLNPEVENLQKKPEKQILAIIPGGEVGSTELYDDDESTNSYQKNKYSKRKITSTVINKKTLKIVLEAATGDYDGMPTKQLFDIKLINRSLPKSIRLTEDVATVTTEFLSEELSTIVHLPSFPTNEKLEVTIEFDESFEEQDSAFNGNKGFLARMVKATEKLKYASALTDWGGTLPNDVYVTSNVVNQLRYDPHNAMMHMKQLNSQKKQLNTVLLKIPNVPRETTEPLIKFLELDNVESRK